MILNKALFNKLPENWKGEVLQGLLQAQETGGKYSFFSPRGGVVASTAANVTEAREDIRTEEQRSKLPTKDTVNFNRLLKRYGLN